MLNVKNIDTFYGRTHVLRGVSLSVQEGEIVCLLGRQGSGKTTILKAIMGIVPVCSGSIAFHGIAITGRRPHEICRMGIGYVPQSKDIFPNLTVEQNLRVVRGRPVDPGWDRGQIYDLFPDLGAIRDRHGLSLSGGEQQMLAIARGLMVNPKLILLDEPSIGLAPRMLRKTGVLLEALSCRRISIVIAEQNVRFATTLSNRGYIVDRGRIRPCSDNWEEVEAFFG